MSVERQRAQIVLRDLGDMMLNSSVFSDEDLKAWSDEVAHLQAGSTYELDEELTQMKLLREQRLAMINEMDRQTGFANQFPRLTEKLISTTLDLEQMISIKEKEIAVHRRQHVAY